MVQERDEKPGARGGRKRDASRDAVILDAALDVLVEVGYEHLTMDAVAARAKAGKATLYRRWASKPELVSDAIRRLDSGIMDLDQLPDTGTLRGDLLALVGLEDPERAQRRARVMAAMSSRMSRELGLVDAGTAAVAPWIEVNRRLIRRAVDRGEVAPDVDVELLSHVVPLVGSGYRTLPDSPPEDGDLLVRLIDNVLLPALRAGP